MERLLDDCGTPKKCWGCKPEPCDQCEPINEALDRLAEYEDTNLTPSDIAALKQQLLEVTAERDALQKSVARIMHPIETIQPRGITE